MKTTLPIMFQKLTNDCFWMSFEAILHCLHAATNYSQRGSLLILCWTSGNPVHQDWNSIPPEHGGQPLPTDCWLKPDVAGVNLF